MISTNLIFLVDQLRDEKNRMIHVMPTAFTTTFSEIIIDFLPSAFTVIAITRSRISARYD